MQVPKRRSEQNRKYAGGDDNFLSAAAIKKLQDDLRRLKEVSHPKAVADLQHAQAMGDLSENAAYSEAKGRLMGINRRILEITELLKNAVLIRTGAGDDGTVRIGATVAVEVNGRTKTYEITGARETNPSAGKISHLSPIGSRLLGHRTGDTVTITVGGKEAAYTIKEVR